MRTALIGNLRAVLNWCVDNGVNPQDPEYIVVRRVQDLMGRDEPFVALWLDGLSNKDYDEINQYLRILNNRFDS